jgi:hypothetical protein
VLGIAGVITPLAAAGLALTMVDAFLTHARLGETERLAAPVVLLALALLIALERFGPQSFSAPPPGIDHDARRPCNPRRSHGCDRQLVAL